MEARPARAALCAAVLFVSMGAAVRTPNFIVETPDPNFARQVAQTAEKHRYDLAVAWLGEPMPNWSAPCRMTVRTGPRLGAGGATTFFFDRGEVFGWRMSIQGSRERILDSVLPHEITHMVFASHFREPLPRWADEGGATSVEHASERMRHRKMLVQFLHTGRGIPLNRMFAVRGDYPRDIMPFYAQSYSVAEHLIQLGGRREYVEFLEDALETDDWSGAIRGHYGIDGAGRLQQQWLAWVRQGSPTLAPKPSAPAPAAAPDTQLLASREPDARAGADRSVYDQLARDTTGGRGSHGPMPGEAASWASSGAATDTTPAPSPENTATALAKSDPRPKTEVLPASGWHPAGTLTTHASTPSASVAAAPPRASVEPVSSHVTRPQPPTAAREIILEWSAPATGSAATRATGW
jgi:hypothetical protein